MDRQCGVDLVFCCSISCYVFEALVAIDVDFAVLGDVDAEQHSLPSMSHVVTRIRLAVVPTRAPGRGVGFEGLRGVGDKIVVYRLAIARKSHSRIFVTVVNLCALVKWTVIANCCRCCCCTAVVAYRLA